MILTAVLLLTLISLKELSILVHKSMKKEIVLYGFLTTINLFLGVLVALKIAFPNPQDVINWIGHTLFGSG